MKEGERMKLLIEFALKKNEIPKDYRRIFIRLFKTALSHANEGKYFNDYYEIGKKKDYTFSVFFQKPHYQDDMIFLEENTGKLYFSTSDKKTGFIFYAALMEQRKSILTFQPDNYLKILSVKQLKEERVHSNSVLVKMASPLCVRSHNREKDFDYYYSTEHEDFEKESRRVLQYQLKTAGFSDTLAQKARLIPLNTKKVIVKFYESQIECSLGYFVLEGDSAVINYLLQSGICSRKSAGFGMCTLQAEG